MACWIIGPSAPMLARPPTENCCAGSGGLPIGWPSGPVIGAAGAAGAGATSPPARAAAIASSLCRRPLKKSKRPTRPGSYPAGVGQQVPSGVVCGSGQSAVVVPLGSTPDCSSDWASPALTPLMPELSLAGVDGSEGGGGSAGIGVQSSSGE